MAKSDDPFAMLDEPEVEAGEMPAGIELATPADYAWALENSKRIDEPLRKAPSEIAKSIAELMGTSAQFDMLVAKMATAPVNERKDGKKVVDSEQIRLSGLADSLRMSFDKKWREPIAALLKRNAPDVAAA